MQINTGTSICRVIPTGWEEKSALLLALVGIPRAWQERGCLGPPLHGHINQRDPHKL